MVVGYGRPQSTFVALNQRESSREDAESDENQNILEILHFREVFSFLGNFGKRRSDESDFGLGLCRQQFGRMFTNPSNVPTKLPFHCPTVTSIP